MIELKYIFELFNKNLITFTLLCVIIVLLPILMNSYYSAKILPPGPFGLPILGYIPFLGKEPHKTISKLSEIYGNVFSLKLWFKNVVILNDFESVKEGLTKDALLGRPDPHHFSYFKKIPSLADDSGQVWSEHRRFSIKLIKKNIENRIIEEINYLIGRINQNRGQPLKIRPLLIPSVSNNISQLVFGHRFNEDDPNLKLLHRSIVETSFSLNPFGLLATGPVWLAKLLVKLGAKGNKMLANYNNKILGQEISEHIFNFNEDNRLDYIDEYLAEMKIRKNKDSNTTFTMDKLLVNCLNLFRAGTDPVRITLEWALLLVAYHSEYQEKLHDEIDSTVGIERSITWADRLMMPFTQAFICEVLRFKTSSPFNLYRRSLEDTHILNHFIPKDTLVLVNFHAVHNDPKIWNNPEQFDPDRFLTVDGKQLIKTEHLIPFSIGKRSCPGETLSRIQLFLYFSSLLQRFSITGVEGNDISLEEDFGLSILPKPQSPLKFKNRF